MKAFYTILLLILSNTFMTFAWYGHLKFGEWKWFQKQNLFVVIMISWGIALFEYLLMVPANRIGYEKYGGPFSLVQLKVIQEVITLTIFSVFALLLFTEEKFKWNHILAFILIVIAVWLVFKK